MSMTKSQCIVILLLWLLFILLIEQPADRIVLQDGFISLVTGEIYKKNGFHGFYSQCPLDSSMLRDTLRGRGSLRWEKLPIPRQFKTEKIEKNYIVPDQSSVLVAGENGTYINPHLFNLSLFYAFFYAFGFESLYFYCLILPLLGTFVYLTIRSRENKQPILVVVLLLFNPIFLFYCYHRTTIDIANMLFVSLLFGGFMLWWQSVKQSMESILLLRSILYAVFFGLLSVLCVMGDWFNLVFIIIFFTVFIRQISITKSDIRVSSFLNSTAILVFLGIYIFIIWFSETKLTVIHHHPFIEYFGFFSSIQSGIPSIVTTVLTNMYLLVRTSLLGLPLLIPALFGLVHISRGDRSFSVILLTMICLKILPVLFIPRLEFSHYILTGRVLLPLLPIAVFLAYIWLLTRPKGEQVLFCLFIVFIGIAGYTFFLARMRIDLFNMGFMEALDKNFTRMYLVFQRIVAS